MSDKTSNSLSMFLRELIVPVLAVSFAIYYYITITGLRWESAGYALVMIAGIIILSIVVLSMVTVKFLRGERWDNTILPEKAANRRQLFIFVLGLIGYVYFISLIGYSTATLLYLAVMFLLLKAMDSWKAFAIITVLSVLLSYFLFIELLNLRLPAGFIINILGGLF